MDRMTDLPKRAKVIPITRGFRKPPKPASAATGPAEETPLQQMLAGLHPRVRAVLVARRGKWQFLERVGDEPTSQSILARIALPDLLGILAKAARPGDDGQRVTVSPWPGFDLAILLRDGVPCYAACFDPETSVYVAEETMPRIAAFFDQSAG
jgi:hypothetical protein